MSITRRQFVKTTIAAGGIASAPQFASGFASPETTSFSTSGHTVYHVRPAKVGRSAIPAAIMACYDGTVLCYTADGERLWEAQTGGNFPFDLCVADIDGDGLDEALVASGGGILYAIDHDGKPLWEFRKTPPLFQVCAARLGNGKFTILTGGVEQLLYALSPEGSLLHSIATRYCIRHLRAGDIRGQGQDYAALALAQSGLTGWLGLMLIDPSDLRTLWARGPIGKFAPNSGKRLFSMVLADAGSGGQQNIILSDSWGEHGKIYAFDHEGNALWVKSDPRIPNIPYRMNQLNYVRLPREQFLIGLFANILILYNLDGSFRGLLTARNTFAGGAFDPATRTFWLGSSTAGGDDVHVLRLDRAGWRQAFQKTRPIGKLAQIERNMDILRQQIAQFQAPDYQPLPSKMEVLLLGGRSVPPLEALRSRKVYRSVQFVSLMTRHGLKLNGSSVPSGDETMFAQVAESRDTFWSQVRDRRARYDLSADQIVAATREWESQGEDFVMKAGHGGAVYMPLSTLERVLQAAPRHLWGFEFAEVEGTSSRIQEVVQQVLLPLAEMCRKYGGKKIIFRNKDIFWNGTCYEPFWSRLLLNAEYREVFVPDMEETNCRTQELSLSGRVGLWMTGAFAHWGCRTVTDNACFDRMWEWSSQQVLSHQFRQLVSRASYGATVYLNSIDQGRFSAGLWQQILPFYDMLEQGIVYIPKSDELLSISSVCLGMRIPPSADYVAHGDNGHKYTYPTDRHRAMVFDRLDCYWGGAPLLPHDFSYYAYGLRRRMTNFLPPTPYGLIAIVPDKTQLEGGFKRKFSTDGESFYDDRGIRRSPRQFRSKVHEALIDASNRFPISVRGEVHWSAARLDAHHVRLTLIDPGYLNPGDRDAQIVFQHLKPVRCTDILTRKDVPITGTTASIRVPMGALRIVDIEHHS